jgi:hypothetical protein
MGDTTSGVPAQLAEHLLGEGIVDSERDAHLAALILIARRFSTTIAETQSAPDPRRR